MAAAAPWPPAQRQAPRPGPTSPAWPEPWRRHRRNRNRQARGPRRSVRARSVGWSLISAGEPCFEGEWEISFWNRWRSTSRCPAQQATPGAGATTALAGGNGWPLRRRGDRIGEVVDRARVHVAAVVARDRVEIGEADAILRAARHAQGHQHRGRVVRQVVSNLRPRARSEPTVSVSASLLSSAVETRIGSVGERPARVRRHASRAP